MIRAAGILCLAMLIGYMMGYHSGALDAGAALREQIDIETEANQE